MFKKSILALAIACASSFAAAAGAYDGVYQAAGSSDYFVVLQNGTTIGAASMSTVQTTGVQFNAAGGKLSPTSTNLWTVATGPIEGNVATITSSADALGACTSVIRLTFDGAGRVAVAVLSSVATAFGTASGYNCAAGVTAATLVKVF